MKYKSKLHKYEMEDLVAVPDKYFFDMMDENTKLLDSCSCHDFKKIKTKTYMCQKCNGIIDANQYKWYKLGREHEVDSDLNFTNPIYNSIKIQKVNIKNKGRFTPTIHLEDDNID